MRMYITVPIQVLVSGEYFKGTRTTYHNPGEPQDIRNMKVVITCSNGEKDITNALHTKVLEEIKEIAIDLEFHNAEGEEESA